MRCYAKRVLIVPVACAAVFALATRAAAQGRVVGEAFIGEPFGVGRLEVVLPEGMLPEPLGLAGLGLTEKGGRVYYPTIESNPTAEFVKDALAQSRRPVLRILGQVLDRSPGKTTIYFLFRGKEPLELTLQSRRPDRFVLPPVASLPGFRQTLAGWWRQYSAAPGFLIKPDYPPWVENYLQSMLSRRLGLALPPQPATRSWEAELSEELRLAGATEGLRVAYEREQFLNPPPAETADQPLPEPIRPGEIEVPDVAADVQIEPLALRVPPEWFYVRFGSFSNFLWTQDTLANWGGDLQNLLATRGLDYGGREKIETRLALQTTLLSRLFGEQVIADVALVGTDLLLPEGGAFGMLFQARSSTVLGLNLNQQRAEKTQKVPGTTERKVKIDGHEVSLLASPDGHVRSFYAADGDFHFVSTSEALMRRFLAQKAGEGSLGNTKEFRYARTLRPLASKDAVFAYLSSRFFDHYVSPAYRIEMLRRLKAEAEIETAELALLAAAAEKSPAETVDRLAAEGFLPPRFGARPDGSRVVIDKGQVRDSLRGERQWFVPIPDVPVAAVSRSEAESYRRFAEFYRTRWQRLSPILACIEREAVAEGRERVTLNVRMTPLNRPQYEKLGQWVGPPDARRLAAIPGDALALDILLPAHRVFGGIQAVGPALEIFNGELVPFGRLRNLLVGYVGTTGDAGLLGFFNRRIVTPEDPAGYARGEGGLWRRHTESFTVFSFQRELLDLVAARLRYEQAERPAQVRLRVADLSQTKIGGFANTWGYYRSRQTALGNLRLAHQLIEQFHVPAARAQTAAELLLDAKLVCPLGGKYVLRQTPEGVPYWTTTMLEAASPAGAAQPPVPPGFQAPPLNWFRGLDLDALLEPQALSVHAELLMQTPKKPESL